MHVALREEEKEQCSKPRVEQSEGLITFSGLQCSNGFRGNVQ